MIHNCEIITKLQHFFNLLTKICDTFKVNGPKLKIVGGPKQLLGQ